ncbi:hypothetical protein SprV_0802474400 [Sparganum proliferum]
MPRIKGIPRQFDPLDSGHKSAADPTQWRETDKTTIERTITTMFKCDPPRTSSHLQAKKSPGEVTHVNNFLESYTSEKGGNAVDPLRTPFTILIPSLSFPFPAKLPIPPLGLELTSVAASTPLTPTPPTDAQSSTGSSKEVGESGKADEKHPTKAGKPAKNKMPKKDGIAPTGALKVKVEAAEEEELEEKEVVNLSDTGLNSPPLRPLLPNSRYYLPERVSNSAKRDRDKEIITCSVCEKTMRRGSLREHMDRHENSGKFECHLCGKTFSRASAREKHIRTHTGERPYICAVCPKSYRQKVHLNEHMRSHTGERPFVCRLCGFSLTSKSLLNRHLRTHGVSVSANDVPEMWLRTDAPTEQVLAAAAEVGRSLVEVEQMGAEGAAAAASEAAAAGQDQGQRSPSALRVTALNGTATVAALARRHLCNVCPAGFPTLQALRSHRLTTHGLMTPHICPTCEASFTSLKLMKVHCRKAHPQICPICDEKMPQRRRWILELHLRDKHPGVSADSLLGPSPMALGRAKRARRSTEDGNSKTAPPKPSKAPRHRAAKVPLPDTEGDMMEEEEEGGCGTKEGRHGRQRRRLSPCRQGFCAAEARTTYGPLVLTRR